MLIKPPLSSAFAIITRHGMVATRAGLGLYLDPDGLICYLSDALIAVRCSTAESVDIVEGVLVVAGPLYALHAADVVRSALDIIARHDCPEIHRNEGDLCPSCTTSGPHRLRAIVGKHRESDYGHE